MTDLFNENTPEQPMTDGVQKNDLVDLFADKLMAIKKEDGTPKYDTLEKALDALAASQAYIPQLEAENKLNKEKAARAAELEELVKRMSNGDTESGKQVVGNPQASGLNEQDAATLVRKILQEDRAVGQAQQNILTVQEKLIKQFGDEAGALTALKAKAKELGTDLQKLKNLSAENPNMVLALFGGSKTSTSVTTSTINGASLKPPANELKAPEQSLLSGPGATDKKRMEFMQQVRERVNQRLGVTT